jgi:hypothetical protein
VLDVDEWEHLPPEVYVPVQGTATTGAETMVELREMIAKYPGDMLADSSGMLKLGKVALKGIPYVGTGMTILFGGLEVLDGSKTPLQATTETGLSIAAGDQLTGAH